MDNRKDKLLKEWNQNRMFYTALFIVGVLFYPIGLIHELGHYLVGLSAGSSCQFFWWLAIQCIPAPQPVLLYFALGGIFGMIASSLLVLSKIVRNNKGIFIGVTTTIFDHFLKATFETYAHGAYLNNPIFGMLMGILAFLFLFIMCRFFTQRAKKKIPKN